jgi:hypothetical protein
MAMVNSFLMRVTGEVVANATSKDWILDR